MSKHLRGTYFRYNAWYKLERERIGSEEFDYMYDQLYSFLSSLRPGQYFKVANLCLKNPSNHDLIINMCDLYRNMDFFIDLKYNAEIDRITILPPLHGGSVCTPPNMYKKLRESPKQWGVFDSEYFI